MLVIVGVDHFIISLCKMRGFEWLEPVGRQFDHVAWAGFRLYDLIFPLFLFLIGVAIPLSLDKLVATAGRGAAVRRILRRTVVLVVIGILFSGGLAGGWGEVRLLGVLQRLGLCYGAAALLYLYLRPRGMAITAVALLVGYWALLTFVPVPGFGAGDFGEGRNLTNWIDAQYLPLAKYDGDHDPEGLLSTLPAIVTCLLGVFASLELRHLQRPSGAKVLRLVLAGLLMLVVGWVWAAQFPVIKKLWTSTFVLVAGGWSLLLLATFYLVIDVWKWRGWTTPFAWVGANALTIYLLALSVVDFRGLAARFAGGDVAAALEGWWLGLGVVAVAALAVLFEILLCGFLYRRKIFLRL